MSSGVKSMSIIVVTGSSRGRRAPVGTRPGQITGPPRSEQPSTLGREEYKTAGRASESVFLMTTAPPVTLVPGSHDQIDVHRGGRDILVVCFSNSCRVTRRRVQPASLPVAGGTP